MAKTMNHGKMEEESLKPARSDRTDRNAHEDESAGATGNTDKEPLRFEPHEFTKGSYTWPTRETVSLHQIGVELDALLRSRGKPGPDSDYGRFGPAIIRLIAEFIYWLRECPEEYERVFPSHRLRKNPREIHPLDRDNATRISRPDADRLKQYFLHYAEWGFPAKILNREHDPKYQEILESLLKPSAQ